MSRVFAVSVREIPRASVMALKPGEFFASDECAAGVIKLIADDLMLYDRTSYPFKLVHPDD